MYAAKGSTTSRKAFARMPFEFNSGTTVRFIKILPAAVFSDRFINLCTII